MFKNNSSNKLFGGVENFSDQAEVPAKKEKIILIVLAIIFFAVLVGAAWDLYGKKAAISYLCSSPNTAVQDNQMTTTAPKTDVPIVNEQNAALTGQNNMLTKTNPATKPAPKADSNIAYSSYSTCLENTKDERAAKDCCDCLSGDASLHKACRDATVNYDFSKNTIFKTFTIPSKLGPNGDYSSFTASGSQQQCKQACESASSGLVCGDYQYCRTACNSLTQ